MPFLFFFILFVGGNKTENIEMKTQMKERDARLDGLITAGIKSQQKVSGWMGVKR